MSGRQQSPQQLAPEFSARVLRDVPMSKHTSWHAGGPADLFFTPRDARTWRRSCASCRAEVPLLWVGLGSNLLVRDGGIRGAVDIDPRRARRARALSVHADHARGRRALRAHRAAMREVGPRARRSSSPAFPAPSAARSR